MKLSELAARLGVDHQELLDQLEVDGVGKFQDLVGAASRSTELESVLQKKQGELAEWQNYYQQVEAQKQQLATQQGGQLSQAQEEWYNDQLFTPIARSFQKLEAQVRDIQEQRLRGFEEKFNRAVQYVAERFDKEDRRRLKDQYSDFDEEKVRGFAKQKGVGDWEQAYLMDKASRMDQIIKEEVGKARLEQDGKTRREVVTNTTEVGTRPGVSPPEKKVAYGDAFGKLRDALVDQGF